MNTKTRLILTIFYLVLTTVTATAQNWYWTRQADSTTEYAGYDAVDRKGNPCYTGYFYGTRISFGSIGELTNLGSQSDFLVKYNTNGTPLWARNATALTSAAYTYGMNVATDRSNNIIETGYFNDSIAFGTFHLTSGTSPDNAFLVKYDENGNVLWATAPSFIPTSIMSSSVYGYSVKCDTNNNIFVSGYFEDTVIFGNDTLTSSFLDMFLVKYNPNGNVLWAIQGKLGVTTGGEIYGTSVAVDDSGNAYVGGTFEDSVYFGPVSISSGENLNIYLAKFDGSGNPKWAEDIPALPQAFWPSPVAVDKSDNVYLACQFSNASLTIGPSTVTDGDPNTCSNSLLAKFSSNGVPLWARCANFISDDEVCVIDVSSIATDRCNSIYWSGICSDTFAVGNVSATVPYGATNPSVGFTYVIKLDSAGNPIAAAALANESTQYFSNGLAIDSNSRVYFDAVLTDPARMIVGSDTVLRYLTDQTSFISKFSIIPSIHNNAKDSICLGDSLTLSIISATGLTYTWSTGATTDSITVKPPSTTTYYVIINNLCNIDTAFVTIVVSSVNPLITGMDSICRGDTDLLTASGGTTYTWSTSQTTSTIKVAPSITTSYTLTAKSGACIKDTTFTVNIKPTPVAAITATPSDSVCRGDSILLTGGGGTVYKWNTGATTSSIWVNPLSAASYTLLVTAGGCPDSTTIHIKNIALTTATVTAVHDTVCPLDTAILTVTTNGGQATYLWSSGTTTSTILVTPSVSSFYNVTVFGKCDTLKDSIKVMVVPLSSISITGTPSKCLGQKDTLTVSGGTTYLWNNGTTSSTYYTGDINADSTISVIAYNSLGCPDSSNFRISISPSPAVSVSFTSVCEGNPVEIYATASGTGPFTYFWSPGGETTDSISVSDVGQTEMVTVSNGCKAQRTFTVTAKSSPLYACCNKTIFLGDDTIIVAGGVTSYEWAPPGGVTCLNALCDSVKVSPTVTTTYTVMSQDSLGCDSERLITITVEIPCFNFTVPNVFTPNFTGPNGVNNLLFIKNTNLSSWSLTIFDRWGKEMYNSTNLNEYWNGNTEGGDKAPDGVYYYIINATCQGNTYKKQGFVQLIR